MIFCTVSTYKHFGLAIVMAKSIRTMHPDAKIILCLVEENKAGVAPYQWLFDEIVLAKQLGFRNFYRHMFRHGDIEGPCSCKARLMLFALSRFPDAAKIIYVDSDMRLYGPLTELETALDQYAIVVTPHTFIPRPKIVRHGYFNAGLLAIRNSPDARKFLQWWANKLDRLCYLIVEQGLNADQKWLDSVPKLFGAYIFPHAGYNIGPWNVDERVITIDENGNWLVNGEPLKLFHFSSILRQSDYTVHLSGAVPNLENPLYKLIRMYHAELNTVGGDFSRIPWSYGQFSNGIKIMNRSRLIFRRKRFGRFKHVRNPFTKSNFFFIQSVRRRKRPGKKR